MHKDRYLNWGEKRNNKESFIAKEKDRKVNKQEISKKTSWKLFKPWKKEDDI